MVWGMLFGMLAGVVLGGMTGKPGLWLPLGMMFGMMIGVVWSKSGSPRNGEPGESASNDDDSKPETS